MDWLHSVFEWSRPISSVWLTDSYGSVYYETNAVAPAHCHILLVIMSSFLRFPLPLHDSLIYSLQRLATSA